MGEAVVGLCFCQDRMLAVIRTTGRIEAAALTRLLRHGSDATGAEAADENAQAGRCR